MIAKSRARSFYLTNLALGKCLLQNALKFYYKMQLVLFVTKRCKNVLQNAAAFFITKCINSVAKLGKYYKMKRGYCN